MLPVLISMLAGMGIGYLLRSRTGLFRILDPATGWIVRLLLFLLGYGIGGDAALVAQIPVLGARGLALAVAAIIGSALAARFMVGRPVSSDIAAEAVPEAVVAEGAPGSSGGRWRAIGGSLAAAAAFFLGVPAGMFFPVAGALPFDPATPVLYILMFLVGIGAGADTTAVTMMKKHGLRMLMLPLAVVIGTFVGTFVIAIFSPSLPIRESLAVGAGFGYYSLSSLVIRELSGGDWAAVALLSNIAREILTLLTAPLLFQFAGPAAPAAAGGATSMDTTLAATVQCAGRSWAVPALFSGVVLTILTPFAVTLVLTL